MKNKSNQSSNNKKNSINPPNQNKVSVPLGVSAISHSFGVNMETWKLHSQALTLLNPCINKKASYVFIITTIHIGIQSSDTLSLFTMLSLLVTFMNTEQSLEALSHSECKELSTQSYSTWTLRIRVQIKIRTSASDYRHCFRKLFWTCMHTIAN